ncbi:MAG: hypothetical protein ACOYKQ_02845, partial [Polymorphobacter sp.]
FGVEGPDVAVYRPWSADWLVSSPAGWTPEALAAALADTPKQARIEAFYPGGRITTQFPPNRTLKTLAAAAALS